MPANKLIHQHWSLRDIAYRLFDTIGIVLGQYCALMFDSQVLSEHHLLACSAAIIIFYLASEVSGMYRNWRGVSLEREIFCLVLTWGGTLPALLAVSVMTKYPGWVDRSEVLIWFVLSTLIIVTARITLRLIYCYLRVHGFNTKGFAIVGINDLGFDMAKKVERSAEMGLNLVGFYDDRDANRLPEIPGEFGEKVGSIDELVADAKSGRVSMIYITFPMRAEERIKGVLEQLSDTTASVYIVPDFFVFELLHSRWTNIGGLPAVSVFENPLYGVGGVLKRAFDLFLASFIPCRRGDPDDRIAFLIKFGSKGPIFFRQKRYGLDGREIWVWKFRTMTVCENGKDVKRRRKTMRASRNWDACSGARHSMSCLSCLTFWKAACR